MSGIDDRSIIAILVGAMKKSLGEKCSRSSQSDEAQNARIQQLEEEVAALKSQSAAAGASGTLGGETTATGGSSASEAPNADTATTTTSSDVAPSGAIATSTPDILDPATDNEPAANAPADEAPDSLVVESCQWNPSQPRSWPPPTTMRSLLPSPPPAPSNNRQQSGSTHTPVVILDRSSQSDALDPFRHLLLRADLG